MFSTMASSNDGNDNSSKNHATTLPVIVNVLVVLVVIVAGVIAVLLLYRKRYSTNASIKRELTLEVAYPTDVVQTELTSHVMFQKDNTTDNLFINIHGTKGSTFEHRVDGQDVNKSVSDIDPGFEIKTGKDTDHGADKLKVEEMVDGRDGNTTEDDISDIDSDIEVKSGKDTDPESDISDLDYDTKYGLKPTHTQRGCSAQNENIFSVTTSAPFRNPNRHRTRASNPYPKPKYKDKSGKDHAQCQKQYTIWKQECTPILPKEQCEVKCSEVFDTAYYDQVERFTG